MNDDFLDLIKEAMDSDFSDVIEQMNHDSKKEKTSINEVSNFSNEKLCSIIAANRYISMDAEMQLACMQELSKRRGEGDAFNFEEKIEEYFKQLPKIDIDVPNITSMLNNFIKKYKI